MDDTQSMTMRRIAFALALLYAAFPIRSGATAGSGHAMSTRRLGDFAQSERQLTCSDFGVADGALNSLSMSWWWRVSGFPLEGNKPLQLSSVR